MALLKNPSEICTMIVDKLKAETATLGVPVKDIYYGDRDAFTDYPAIAVEVIDNPVEVKPPSYRGKYRFAAYIMVYFGQYSDAENVKKEADEFGELVRDVLNEDPQWKDIGGNQQLIAAWVTRLEPGYARRGSRVFATRITWEALSQAPLN
jgi:hypothetical protein